MTKIYDRTIFELTWGAGIISTQPRHFGPCNMADAAVRFSERVVELDRDPLIGAAWVRLKRLPDSIYPKGLDLVYWTKTSNERPTIEGAFYPEDVK